MKKIVGVLFSCMLCQYNYAQNVTNPYQLNTITTAVPFLNINPHAQSMGIADIGVVAAKGYYESGLTQNPALLARNEKVIGGKLSYKPWLRHIVADINILDANLYYSINKKITIGYSFNLLSLGSITFTDPNSQRIIAAKPKEYYHNFRYAQALSPNFSIGVGLKYIVSDLTNNQPVGGKQTHKGRALAADFGLDYRKEFAKTETSFWRFDIGLAIQNMGNKVKYVDNDTVDGDFLPMQLAIGAMLTYTKDINENVRYSIDVAYQAEKLLVPTPPIYLRDSVGQIIYNSSNDPVIITGNDPNVSVITGALRSFNDAPGGSSEERNEIIHKVGMENRFTFNNAWTAAIRTGFFHENELKGNRVYWNIGLGVRYKFIYLDFATILRYKERQFKGDPINVSGIKYPYSYNITIGFKHTFGGDKAKKDEDSK